jgi:predicted ATPase
MKIDNLSVRNFRGIREVDLNDLGNMIIIAGQNGSGKSCIFDAIRLLKSVYGGYQQNEWQQWMGEFQIQLSNRSSDFSSMFNDATRELRISCDFRLSNDERTYISINADQLLSDYVWRTILPEAFEWGGFRMAMFAAQFRQRQPEALERVAKLRPDLISDLAKDVVRGECFIPVGGLPQIVDSVALSVIFSTFNPRNIGVIDYHGAQRHYNREFVTGINLNLDTVQQQRSQSSLYNYGAKYNNVKSEMASSYLRELLSEKAGSEAKQQDTLTDTLKELFTSFFPEKEFLGPQPTPDGALSFPVRTIGGNTHDLDELSAGEKEIIYGYLRIRNSAPKNSIILLDEPELHLNPRLIRGLPQFYQKNLGEALSNQMWLVTHSDALLREVVGRDKYNVFHMLPCANVAAKQGQLRPLLATADLELALVDLVGDLASYRPGGKVVIFEGGGDSDFDQRVAASLFPELQEQANLISGSNKTRVRALHETLMRASQMGQLPFQFFAVTDNDSEISTAGEPSINRYSWDVYHIENYFLEPKYIARVLAALTINNLPNEEEIADDLRECARETMPQLLRHELSERTNNALVGAINLGTDPSKGDIAGELRAAVERSLERLVNVGANEFALAELRIFESDLRTKFEGSLADGSWRRIFRGRDILRKFAGKRARSISYEVFRNLILSQMKDDGFQPKGMKEVVESILNA